MQIKKFETKFNHHVIENQDVDELEKAETARLRESEKILEELITEFPEVKLMGYNLLIKFIQDRDNKKD